MVIVDALAQIGDTLAHIGTRAFAAAMMTQTSGCIYIGGVPTIMVYFLVTLRGIWLLIAWRRKDSWHQQPWYWLSVSVICRRQHQKRKRNGRVDSRFAPCQWETSLRSNAVSHWLGANLESALTGAWWGLYVSGDCVTTNSVNTWSSVQWRYHLKHCTNKLSWHLDIFLSRKYIWKCRSFCRGLNVLRG